MDEDKKVTIEAGEDLWIQVGSLRVCVERMVTGVTIGVYGEDSPGVGNGLCLGTLDVDYPELDSIIAARKEEAGID